jgi:hypothetical protein
MLPINPIPQSRPLSKSINDWTDAKSRSTSQPTRSLSRNTEGESERILRILKDTSKPKPVNKHKKRRHTHCKGSPKKGVEASAGGIARESEKRLQSACRGECGVVREGLGLVLSQK